MPSGWTAAASLNTNVDVAANLGYTPMNNSTNISAMTGYSAVNSRISANDSKVGWANQYTNSHATSAAAGMNLTDFSNFGTSVQTGVNNAADYVTRFQSPEKTEVFGKNELTCLLYTSDAADE